MYVMCVKMVMEQVCQQFQEIMEEEECDDETLCVTLTVESFRLSTRRAAPLSWRAHHRYQSSVNSIMHNVFPTLLLNVQQILFAKKTVQNSSSYAINGFSLLQNLLGSFFPLLQIVW